MRTTAWLLSAFLLFGLVGCGDGETPLPEDTPAANTAESGDDYPLTTCVVSNEPLGADPVVVTHEETEVRLCCQGCVRTFNADPAKFVAALKDAGQ